MTTLTSQPTNKMRAVAANSPRVLEAVILETKQLSVMLNATKDYKTGTYCDSLCLIACLQDVSGQRIQETLSKFSLE